jgi:hypothetical protein
MEEPTGIQNFLEILTKPDNIPIAVRQAFKNDKLTEDGKKDEIAENMWK